MAYTIYGIPLCNILHNVHSDNTITNYNSMLECDLGYRNISCNKVFQ